MMNYSELIPASSEDIWSEAAEPQALRITSAGLLICDPNDIADVHNELEDPIVQFLYKFGWISGSQGYGPILTFKRDIFCYSGDNIPNWASYFSSERGGDSLTILALPWGSHIPQEIVKSVQKMDGGMKEILKPTPGIYEAYIWNRDPSDPSSSRDWYLKFVAPLDA
jgi:hypothetical protein